MILQCPNRGTQRRVLIRFYNCEAHNHTLNTALRYVEDRDVEGVVRALRPVLQAPPFSQIIVEVIAACVGEIIPIESRRGDVPKAQRSQLAPESEKLQEIIDRVLFEVAGFSQGERHGLEERLEAML